jgi:non-ribosomal peptide synthetase component F
MFVFQNLPALRLELPGLAVRPIPVESGLSKFDLSVYVEDAGPSISIQLEYKTDLYDAATVERLGRRYLALLRGAAEHADRAIGDLPLDENA